MRTKVLFGALAALIVAAAAAVYLTLPRRQAADADMRSTLSGLDAAIAGGSLSTAHDTLASIPSLPSSEEGQLRLLKRAWQVGSGTGDFTLLAEMADRALAANGRSARIRAIAAYGNLRSGRLSSAEKILARKADAGSGGDSLRGEAQLRRGGRWSGSDDLVREILALEGVADPGRFSVAALRAGDGRLSLDAAILAMEQGSIGTALRLVRAELDDARFDEAAGLISYDGGDFDTAESRMERLNVDRPGVPTVGLQIADILAADGKDADSERALLRTLPLAPAVSWTPYADLALFAIRRGDTAAAARWIDDGLAFFPRSRELRLMRARLDIRAGDPTAAESLLAGLLADRPADGEAALLLLALQGPRMSPEASRARLWKLFDTIPSDTALFDALASSLIAARDWDGMQIAVRQYQESQGQPDARLLLYQGFAAAMSGDDARAAAAFRQSSLMARDGTARFDLALLILRRGDARAALAELDGAAEEVDRHPSAPLMSRIETLRGAARLMDGDAPGAGTALGRALALDPHNLRAGLLLKKLEAGGQ